jgi:hypothetical protein
VLTRYRRMEMLTAEVIEPEMAAFRAVVVDRGDEN